MTGKEILTERIKDGTAVIGDGEVVGHASNGQDVTLGYVYDKKTTAALYAYLEANPEPTRW